MWSSILARPPVPITFSPSIARKMHPPGPITFFTGSFSTSRSYCSSTLYFSSHSRFSLLKSGWYLSSYCITVIIRLIILADGQTGTVRPGSKLQQDPIIAVGQFLKISNILKLLNNAVTVSFTDQPPTTKLRSAGPFIRFTDLNKLFLTVCIFLFISGTAFTQEPVKTSSHSNAILKNLVSKQLSPTRSVFIKNEGQYDHFSH